MPRPRTCSSPRTPRRCPQVEQAGLFAELPAEALDAIPAKYRPQSGLWTGFVARSTVLVYNTEPGQRVRAAGVDHGPRRARVGRTLSFSPTGADFQAIVAAILELEGEDATRAWLEGSRPTAPSTTATTSCSRRSTPASPRSASLPLLLGPRPGRGRRRTATTAQYYFFGPGPGRVPQRLGRGILESSDMKDEAQQFIEFLVERGGPADARRQLRAGVPAQPGDQPASRVKPFSELEPPAVNVSDLDAEAVVDLMTEIGLPLSSRPRAAGQDAALGSWPEAPRRYSSRRAAVAALTLLPLGYVLWTDRELGPGEAKDFLLRPRIGELLWNTVRLLVAGVRRARPRRRRRVGRRAHRPTGPGLVARPAVRAARRTGVRQRLRLGLHDARRAVVRRCGAGRDVVVLPVGLPADGRRAARLDPAVEEVAARSAGAAGVSSRGSTLPAVSPAVLGGALLVGLHLLAEYGALQLLNYPTLTTAILQQYATVFNGPEATLLALVLVMFCLLLLGLELLLRGRRRRARVGSGASGVPNRIRLGRLRVPLMAADSHVRAVGAGRADRSLARWLVRGTSTGSTSAS